MERPSLNISGHTLSPAFDSPSLMIHYYGPRSLNLTRRHGHFLKLTWDIAPSDTRKNIRDTTWDISSTGDMRAYFRGHMGHGHSSDNGH